MSDLYESPKSIVGDVRKGNLFLAIIIGVVVDFGLTLVAGGVLGSIIGFALLEQGIPASQLEAEIDRTLPAVMDSAMGYGFTAIGLFASFLGAFLAAKYSNHKEYTVATVLAVIALLVSWLVEDASSSALKHYTLVVLGVAVIYLGARTHVRGKL
ncbi:hypothetical protein [Ketobacter sp.]|uniref:hypothetical protein n=1 Tax=Ketobacter sp. TaxID=2083498 RepID=UPI000F25B67A|nr:hypothetical protein [Ketobacter sp.]RLU01841.1 MAG: hypothetical protein D9N14_00640 [Ketobacter sp.]